MESATVVILLRAQREAVRQGVDPFQNLVPLRGGVGSSVGNPFFCFLAEGRILLFFAAAFFLLFFFVQIVVSLVALVSNFALPWLVCNILQRCSV